MSVIIKGIENGILFDCRQSFYPARMHGHAGGSSAYPEISSYYFGYVGRVVSH